MADRYWVGGSSNWVAGTNTPWSTTSGGSGGASAPTTSDNAIFDQAGTYTVTLPGSANCANWTVSAGTVTFNLSVASTSTLTIAGNVDFTGSGSGTNIGGIASAIGIILSGAAITLNMQGRTITNQTLQINCSTSCQLLSAFNSITNTLKITHVRGTLDLNNFAFYAGTFTATANSRTIAFGSSGFIQISGTGTPLNITAVGGSTATGNPLFIFNSGGSAISAIVNFRTSIAFATQTGGFTFQPDTTNGVNNLDFTNFSGTWSATTATFSIYGNLTLSTGMTSTGSAFAMIFSGTSGTQTITSNGKALNMPVTVNSVGGTLQLVDNLNLGTQALTLTNGTFDGNSQTVTTSGGITMITGSAVMKNVTSTAAVTHTSGTLTQGAANTVGAYTFTAGTLDLSSYQLNATTFTSSNSNTRNIAFGTGNITLSGSGAIWNTFTNTGFSVTGTKTVNLTYAGATASSIAPGPLSETNAINFNVTAGSYAITTFTASANYFGSLNFQGFTGTAPTVGSLSFIYGNLTLGSTITSFGTTGTTVTFTTTGTQVVTSNSKTFNSKIIFNGVGGTLRLGDNLTMVSTVDFALQAGTLDLNGNTLTVGAVTNAFATYLTGTRSILFNGGTLICPYAGATAFANNAPTGFTTTAGTGVGKISFTSASAKGMTGGNGTYNCVVSNDGAGLLSIIGNNTIDTVTSTSGNVAITGTNTITTLTNAVQPVTYTFTSGTTQTITNWNVVGTPGNLVTINSSAAGSAATLSKAGGFAVGNYLSIKDSAGTGTSAWYAGATSTNVSGNTGWVFISPGDSFLGF